MYLKENMINIVKRVKRMTDSLGHSNNFATLSQVLTYNRLYTASPLAGALIYGFSCIRAREAALFFYPATEYIKYFKDNRHHDEM